MNENAQKLVAALRSGEFKQHTNTLANEDLTAHCCLGVACELFRRETGVGSWSIGSAASGVGSSFSTPGESTSADLPYLVRDWIGFRTASGNYGRFGDRARSMVHLNDVDRLSFREIADVIESEPEGMFARPKPPFKALGHINISEQLLEQSRFDEEAFRNPPPDWKLPDDWEDKHADQSEHEITDEDRLTNWDKPRPRLSTPQRDLLRDIGGCELGEGYVHLARRRTAEALASRGLLRRQLRGWYAITNDGRAVLPSARR